MTAAIPLAQSWAEVAGDAGIPAAVVLWLWHRNCTEKGCWRWGHSDPEHGHPRCRRHSKLASDTDGRLAP